MIKDFFITMLTALITFIITVFLAFLAKAILSLLFELIYIIGG